LIALIDIDNDNPYHLSSALLSLAPHLCAVRLSATKGVHMKVFGLSDSNYIYLKNRIDDQYRLALDESRAKRVTGCTNVLWDVKNGKRAGVWVTWNTHDLGEWLLSHSSYSLRDCIVDIYNGVMLREFVSNEYEQYAE